jgi:hypothetical protein
MQLLLDKAVNGMAYSLNRLVFGTQVCTQVGI